MGEKLKDRDLWLPAEFIGEDFFHEESGLVGENASLASSNMRMEMESDEEDYIAGLTRQMAHSFLAEDNKSSFWDTRVLATSPQSTLCDAGIWSASCAGRPNGSSKVSPPLSTFLEQRKEDAMDLLYAAAGEILRKKQNEQRDQERRLLYQMKNPSVHTKSSAAAGYYNQDLARQQIQAAQFYKLKQQQLIKQQLSSAWNRQNRAVGAISNRSHGSASSAWPPLQQQQQPSSGMRAIFLNNPGGRRESAGTGVFLPRRAGSPTGKKPACSTVLLPARVVQALNLTLDDAGVQSRCPAYISHEHETASARIKPTYNEQKRNIYQLPPASISGHEIRLPKEWTY
ncbi:hypothetical protein IEQ34_008310 [Dendrobium chrysotoxum]|uniref:Uncharacterized protein n=1 Tax=Dendrobium chrysotoxum TaxID=161865 RepID=A0AAV7GXF0_DENCH|nr:hypothetical protein IEQ34_008310 [Dendrobium chrysotoxum]